MMFEALVAGEAEAMAQRAATSAQAGDQAAAKMALTACGPSRGARLELALP